MTLHNTLIRTVTNPLKKREELIAIRDLILLYYQPANCYDVFPGLYQSVSELTTDVQVSSILLPVLKGLSSVFFYSITNKD